MNILDLLFTYYSIQLITIFGSYQLVTAIMVFTFKLCVYNSLCQS